MGRDATRVLLFDNSGWRPRGTSRVIQFALTRAWRVGTRVFPGVSVGAISWKNALNKLGKHQAEHGLEIVELHVWGHGNDGWPALGPGPTVVPAELGAACPGLEAVWWRSCEVHRGPDGRKFAEDIVEITDNGCVSVGHCEVITAPLPWEQRAVCGLRPGERAHWRSVNGVWCSVAPDRAPIELPAVSTFRPNIPWNKEGVWAS